MIASFSFDFLGDVVPRIELIIRSIYENERGKTENTLYEAVLRLFIERRELGVSASQLKDALRGRNKSPEDALYVFIFRLKPRLHAQSLQLVRISYELPKEVVYYIVPTDIRAG